MLEKQCSSLSLRNVRGSSKRSAHDAQSPPTARGTLIMPTEPAGGVAEDRRIFCSTAPDATGDGDGEEEFVDLECSILRDLEHS